MLLVSPPRGGEGQSSMSIKWDREADVVVVGSGATGMPAAIVAREAGASVIVVEAEPRIGGHAITSGGNLPLGGGTSYQKKYGVTLSLPSIVGRDGVAEVLTPQLSDEEAKALDQSAESIAKALERVQ